MHTGGMQALLGDGSVRFISENIDATTRQRLAYIADGNVIGEF
jgi:prepilin-type processing-associated H-X9-DG protein